MIFVFKQKTAYEMRISDWSSDVCSSDLTSHQSALSTVRACFNRPASGRPKPAPTSRPRRADCGSSATAAKRTAIQPLNALDLTPKLWKRAVHGRSNDARAPDDLTIW